MPRTTGAHQVNSAYHRRVAFPNMLGNSTSRQLHNASPVVVIPVGSTEQHGPHLPLDTDTRIATAVAEAVADELGRGSALPVLVGPAVAYGASGEHEGFAGTISIGTEALKHLLVEFGRSAMNWANRLVFVNGHGGNVGALATAVGPATRGGPGRGLVPVRGAGRGRARRAHRNLCIATSFTV